MPNNQWMIPDFNQAERDARNLAIRTLADKQVEAGPTPAVTPDPADSLMLWDAETGAPFFALVSAIGGSGTGTVTNPKTLDPVQWFSYTLAYYGATPLGGAWTGAAGPGADPRTGATISANPGTGVSLDSLIINYGADMGYLVGLGTTVAVGDRILVINGYSMEWDGIYTVTDLGTAPDWDWVLTRASDLDTAAAEQLFYKVELENTPYYAVGPIAYADVAPTLLPGSNGFPFALMSGASEAFGAYSVSVANGVDPFASNVALGSLSVAGGVDSVAIGREARAIGTNTVALGLNASSVYATDGVAVGAHAQVTHSDATAIGSYSRSIREGATTVGGFNGAIIVNAPNAVQQDNFYVGLNNVGLFIRCNKATTLTVTVPVLGGATAAFGTETRFAQIGSGAVTLSAAPGVTLTGKTTTTGVNDVISLLHLGADTWYAF